jgi:hypothetical protein
LLLAAPPGSTAENDLLLRLAVARARRLAGDLEATRAVLRQVK